MTRRIEDLEHLITEIQAFHNNKFETTLTELRYFIARDMGYSDYIINSTIKALDDFGFINIHPASQYVQILYGTSKEEQYAYFRKKLSKK